MPTYLVELITRPGVMYEVSAEEYERLRDGNWLVGDPDRITPEALDEGLASVVEDTQSLTRAALEALGIAPADASTTTKGLVQLAGDLSGTAEAPTVPGLASKINSSTYTAGLAGKADVDHEHDIGDLTATGTPDATTYLRGDGTWSIPPGDGSGSGDGGSSYGGTVLPPADPGQPLAIEVDSDWGVDATGAVYYDPAGAQTGEDVLVAPDVLSGQFVAFQPGIAALDDPDSAPSVALRATYGRPVEALEDFDVRMQNMRRSKGVRIGTGGKGVVAFRFDHRLDPLRTTVWPELVSRAMPGGVGVVTRAVENPADAYEPTSTTWAQLHAMNKQGLEIWSHSHTHGDAADYDTLVAEIEQSRTILEAQGLKVQGWQMPGTTPKTAPYSGTFTGADWDTDVGRLLRKNYVLWELDLGSTRRALPADGCPGLGHITIDSLSLSTFQNVINDVAERRWGVEFMLHPNAVGVTLSLADFQAMLDYVQTFRDAGRLEVLTPSGLAFADPGTSARLDLVGGMGSFEGYTDAAPGLWQSVAITADFLTTGGRTGTTFARFPNTALTRPGLNHDHVDDMGLLGETFMAEAWFRAPSADATGTLRVREAAAVDKLYEQKNIALTGGGGWTRLRVPFSLPTTVTSFRVEFGRVSGDVVDVDDVTVLKV